MNECHTKQIMKGAWGSDVRVNVGDGWKRSIQIGMSGDPSNRERQESERVTWGGDMKTGGWPLMKQV